MSRHSEVRIQGNADRHNDSSFDFSTLSLKDLIEARDLYHFHLMSKANVVGTAVGLYLIRNKEEWPRKGYSPPKLTFPRDFQNSGVRSYSWPCILVLVREWLDETDFGPNGKAKPWQIVPKTLYLPDGRAVPVCTVLAPPQPSELGGVVAPIIWPHSRFGGGLPLQVSVQHEDHVATIGCLMSDGHTTYALTARHACGEPGTPVSAILRKGPVPIGVSSERQITRKLFSKVYPAFAMRQTYLGLDVGLVRIENLDEWTCNIYGLPPIKPIYDLYEQNLSLRKLIDQPVVAMGAASGLLYGRIKAMFYRYRSVGGFDYVGDLLIAPQEGHAGARHGDTGALWHLQMPADDGSEDTRTLMQRDLRPLGVEWGAQIFAESNQRSSFSVATTLSNISKLLDVELVVTGSDGVSGTWGRTGHYSIGTMAIGQVKNPKLKKLLEANADSLSLPLDRLSKEIKDKDLIAAGFVPLADVPDIVWKKLPSPHLNRKGEDIGVKGGRDVSGGPHGSSGPEHANHHCDADLPFEGFATLREACIARKELISPAAWNAYYEALPTPPDVNHKGILPFRIWQYFEAMKNFAAKTDLSEFVAAAGTLAHYVGDACQPLHGTHLHDGDESRPVPGRLSKSKDRDKNSKPSHFGEGVHSFYETAMIDRAAEDNVLFEAISNNLGTDHDMQLVNDGREVAHAVLQMMDEVAKTLSPQDLMEIYEEKVDGFGHADKDRLRQMWKIVGEPTGKVMALGIRTLAMIWDAAWAAGNGDSHDEGELGEIDPDALKAHYEDKDFIPSLTIETIGAVIGAADDFAASGGGRVAAGRRRAPRKAALRRA
jgi:hypothetical protein